MRPRNSPRVIQPDFQSNGKEDGQKHSSAVSQTRDGQGSSQYNEDAGAGAVSTALRDLRCAVCSKSSPRSQPIIDVPSMVSINTKSKLQLRRFSPISMSKKSTPSRFPWSSSPSSKQTSGRANPAESGDLPPLAQRNSRSLSPKKGFRLPHLRGGRSKSSDRESKRAAEGSSDKKNFNPFGKKPETKLDIIGIGSDACLSGSNNGADPLMKSPKFVGHVVSSSVSENTETSWTELLKKNRKSPQPSPSRFSGAIPRLRKKGKVESTQRQKNHVPIKVPSHRKKSGFEKVGVGSRQSNESNNSKDSGGGESDKTKHSGGDKTGGGLDEQPLDESKQPKDDVDAKTHAQPSDAAHSGTFEVSLKQALPWSTFDERLQPDNSEKRDGPPTDERDQRKGRNTAGKDNHGAKQKEPGPTKSENETIQSNGALDSARSRLDKLHIVGSAEGNEEEKDSMRRSISQYIWKTLGGGTQNRSENDANRKKSSKDGSSDEESMGPALPEKMASYLAMSTVSSGRNTDLGGSCDDDGVCDNSRKARKTKRLQAIMSASFSVAESSIFTLDEDDNIRGHGCFAEDTLNFGEDRCFGGGNRVLCEKDIDDTFMCEEPADDTLQKAVLLDSTRVVLPKKGESDGGGHDILCGLLS